MVNQVLNQGYDLSNFAASFFHFAICDIPYGINVGKMAYLKETGTTVKQKNGKRLNPNKKKKIYTQKDWDKETPPQSYFDEVKRVSRNYVIFGAQYTNWEGLDCGQIRWDKGVPDGVSFNRYEYAHCSLIPKDEIVEIPLLWAGMMQAKSLSQPMVQQGNKKLNEKRIHPCHKPRLLYRAIFNLLEVKPDMNILDTHVGGGSIRIEAFLHKLNFYGYEIDEEYWTKQEERYKKFTSQLRLF